MSTETDTFEEHCRIANRTLDGVMEALWAIPEAQTEGAAIGQLEALYEARQSVAAAQVALRSIAEG